MKIAITGGTGFVGRFIVEDALAGGHEVTVFSRRPGVFSAPVHHQAFDLNALGDVPLEGFDALIHAAFDHVPGRYRGGEGDDPTGFLRRNLDGTVALFEAAVGAGVPRIVFLSSRAVYGDYPAGTLLSEGMTPRPDTLYGRAKHEAEMALEELARDLPVAVSLRATGVYGPAGAAGPHKWTQLFDDFRRGATIPPHVATEVHGDDLASAVRLFFHIEAISGTFNVSDLRLDRRDLLMEVVAVIGSSGSLPVRSNAPVSEMMTHRLRSLGWTPGGMTKLRESLRAMLAAAQPGMSRK